ncbi:phospholipid carrier-dependent glycosyltransferase [Variovorax sp. J22P168]|uniref:phospholipid carrier-dependent glycosyltransferase n=1 Tax=Variovorax jilinensis TaxID=3053513 RepID=UPI002575A2B0|nr:phospholipid carrier-dependent glycosyltransferase [Variovorax sp. J22P168]MDM0014371.1 phospholipid carrier-dependent glycosyltransferase [Variovorax sp. J22P168]
MFGAAHYAAVFVFALACWGFGRALLSRIGAPPGRRDVWLETALAGAAGLALFICVFQAIAIAGLFGRASVLGAVALGLLAAALQAPAWWREVGARERPAPASFVEKLALVVLALTALPALVEPLAPPAAFDELMYHLPYARELAQTGRLGIHEWLRYPWFPYNYNLLHAGALVVGDDVLPHLLSGLGGWLSVWMVYRLGLLHAGRITAAIAAAIWLGIGDYESALIDIGVGLFVLAACTVLWWWRETSDRAQGPCWLALAAFFLGVAAGSKYQALTVLPLVAVFVVRRERRLGVWAVAAVCFLLPCIYWYARNAVLTGDPFNPIGARVFGFTNWNLADYKNQFDDVRAHAAWPNAFLWGVLFVPFAGLWKRSPALRAAAIFSAYSLFVWALTSRYPRYLTASVPLIALVSVVGWQALLGGIADQLRRWMPGWNARGLLDRAGHGLALLLIAVGVAGSLYMTRRSVAAIATTPAERSAFLDRNVPGYAVMNHLREHALKGRVYQIALSEATYYGPSPVWGDAIGPWRYTDFIVLPPAEFARKLHGLGFEAIGVGASAAPALEAQPGFLDHFALMYERAGAKAYRILAPQNDLKP